MNMCLPVGYVDDVLDVVPFVGNVIGIVNVPVGNFVAYLEGCLRCQVTHSCPGRDHMLLDMVAARPVLPALVC